MSESRPAITFEEKWTEEEVREFHRFTGPNWRKRHFSASRMKLFAFFLIGLAGMMIFMASRDDPECAGWLLIGYLVGFVLVRVFITREMESEMANEVDAYLGKPPVTVTIGADGIRMDGEHWTSLVRWSWIGGIERARIGLVLRTTEGPVFHAIPLRFLPEDLSPEDAMKQMEEWRTASREGSQVREPA